MDESPATVSIPAGSIPAGEGVATIPARPASRHPNRADEYRAKAAAAAAAGAAASLEQVRAKHERAFKVWTELAEIEAIVEAGRAARAANPGARRLAPEKA